MSMDLLSPLLAAKAIEARTLLARIAVEVAPAVFTTSFGAEDMAIFDLIAGYDDAPGGPLSAIAIATLDTGRLPEETYAVWQRATARYGRPVEAYFPQAQAIEPFVRIHGINAFYDSVALRHGCCEIRKVEPLSRILAGRKAWITGLRRSQSTSRADLVIEAWDDERGLVKASPLADWSDEDLWTYLRARDVPINALHAKGYPSIGCAPCTRAITPGEDPRAGRWWWEQDDLKECGLHVAKREAVPA